MTTFDENGNYIKPQPVDEKAEKTEAKAVEKTDKKEAKTDAKKK
jgi:hypothetical protein